MDIDLSLLHSRTKEEIDITGTYTIPKEYFHDSPVLELNNISVTGKVYMSHDDDTLDEDTDYVEAKIAGEMIIADSISLEPVSYPFTIEYDDILEENCKKDENTLDIFQFLWEILYWRSPYSLLRLKISVNFTGMDGDWLVKKTSRLKIIHLLIY